MGLSRGTSRCSHLRSTSSLLASFPLDHLAMQPSVQQHQASLTACLRSPCQASTCLSGLESEPCGQAAADLGEGTDLEALCSQLTLDVIGKAVFNYDFDSLTTHSPLIQVCPPTGLAVH